MKFYENSDVHLRKIDEKLVKGIVDKIFETIMKNYSPNNPVYISDYSPDDEGVRKTLMNLALAQTIFYYYFLYLIGIFVYLKSFLEYLH